MAVVTQTGAVVTFQNDPDVKSFDLLLDISDRVSRDGDRGSGGNPNGNGQNTGRLLGSVLRILP